MIKQWTTYLLGSILASYFLLAGIGVNIVTFCCSSCAEQGIEHVVENGCSDLHCSHNETAHECCHHHGEDCAEPIHQGRECKFWRVTLSDVMLNKAELRLPDISCMQLPWLDISEANNQDQASLLICTQILPFFTDILLEDDGRTMLARHCLLLI
ncbi:MAG: hypothetical protein J6U94_05235 [Paludibacteraceae bacterium]|nr:hypothetical protein [Paludibacteraceae bacterium]MBO7259445.1 hypothetical protein [Paludibacteraceae bacterium]